MSGATPKGAAALPYIDEHSVVVSADAATTWSALLEVVERPFSFGGATALARLLGAVDGAVSGPRPLSQGSAFPGFHVERALKPTELALVGRHRFSNYALTFRVDNAGAHQTPAGGNPRRVPGHQGKCLPPARDRNPGARGGHAWAACSRPAARAAAALTCVQSYAWSSSRLRTNRLGYVRPQESE